MSQASWQAELRPSRWMAIYGLILHGVALFGLLSLSRASAWAVLSLILISCSGYLFYTLHQADKAPKRISQLRREGNGRWQITFANARMVSGLHIKRTIIIEYAVMLCFTTTSNKEYTVWVLADQVSAQQHHALRLYCSDERLYPQ